MALKRKQKTKLIKDLVQRIREAKAIIFTNFHGLSSRALNQLRQELKKKGIYYKAVKKTLLQRALNQAGFQGIDVRSINGQIALAICLGDEIELAKELYRFQKEQEKQMILKAILEGKILDKDEVISLARLPGVEFLQAKLIGTLKAPISGFLNVVLGNQRKLVYVLWAIKEKKAGKN